MDGAESDLRTGLPWQMLEVHEPVRLSIVVEVQVSVLRRIVDEDPELRQLVGGGWIFLAALDPSSATLVELDGRSRPYAPGRAQPVTRGGSHRHYEGRRGHLPFATIEPYDGAAR
jgi:hypothetical protein